MDMSQYGPFAAVITIAAALAASFSLLLLKTIGTVSRWSWLADNSPPFIVSVGARALSVALIAMSFVLINKTNYLAFIVAAIAFGFLTVVFILRFERLRRIHIHRIPIIQSDGVQAVDIKGTEIFESVVIGTEEDLKPEVKRIFEEARQKAPGLSLTEFMSGFGATKTNNPESLWTREYLASVSNKLTMALMGIVLCGVMALYESASVVEVVNRTTQ